jgi:hypothetical protein
LDVFLKKGLQQVPRCNVNVLFVSKLQQVPRSYCEIPTPQELHIDLATIATDVTFLQSLTRLRKLGLTGCYKVTSLEPMAALTSLSALDISDSRCQRLCSFSLLPQWYCEELSPETYFPARKPNTVASHFSQPQ